MMGAELVGAAGVLFGTAGAGMIAHELAHALVLRALGVPYVVRWLPDGDTAGRFGVGVHEAWATVSPRSIPRDLSSWGLRLAAVAPLALATPALLVLVGVLPDPLASGNPFAVAATVAWLGCALPSPQDFSLFWYADRLVEGSAGVHPADGVVETSGRRETHR